MELFPAIDLRGGQVVRLHQGDYGRETVYGTDPVAVAKAYEAEGAPWIHVVDLDAARAQGDNRALVAAVAAAVSVPVQTGGGVRSMADVTALLDAGARRLVIGTAAFRVDGFVAEAAAAHPGSIAVDLGVGADGNVTVQGWQETVDETLEQALERFSTLGVAAFVVTSVGQDGTLAGPDLDLYRRSLAATAVPVVASGGVGTLDDLRALATAGLPGAIVGRALFEGRFTVAEALAALT